mgnify:CR=1 FL=1
MNLATKLATGVVVSALVFACGGSTKQPDAPVTPPAEETPAAPPAEEKSSGAEPEAAEESSAAETSASEETADADAGAPTPKPIQIEVKDECTPVAVDFEKRARPSLKACYREGKKKDPNLEGTVKLRVTVDVKGKIKSIKVVEKTLPNPVADCMLKALKATPFPEVEKCWNSTLTIPVTFPTPP